MMILPQAEIRQVYPQCCVSNEHHLPLAFAPALHKGYVRGAWRMDYLDMSTQLTGWKKMGGARVSITVGT